MTPITNYATILGGLFTFMAGSGAQAQTPDECSCSPTLFTLRLKLEQTCYDDDTLIPFLGIQSTSCNVLVDGESGDSLPNQFLEVVGVLFKEYDHYFPNGWYSTIHEDDTYADVSLADGDVLTFKSISKTLDTSLPLEDQMSGPALVPGGASLIIYGKNENDEEVVQTIRWSYNLDYCDGPSFSSKSTLGDTTLGVVQFVSVVDVYHFMAISQTQTHIILFLLCYFGAG